MPGEEQKPEVTTEKIEGIPLYLIPKAIADQIKKKGEAVFEGIACKGVGVFETLRDAGRQVLAELKKG